MVLSLDGSNILVGVSGGIAAYKAAELISRLQKQGANVRVVMTESGAQFVSPVTFQTLTGFPARTKMFGDWSENFIPHIANAQWADAIVIVPATANVIGKIAGGIADDLLTSTITASEVPVLLAPSMNSAMYENPIVQQNIAFLRTLGYIFVDPAYGRLACGTDGKGRLAPLENILSALEKALSIQDLARRKFLITAGGTRESIDPVRFISNRSSGKMGYALASAAVKRGGSVTLVSAPTDLPSPAGAQVHQVESAFDMLEACWKRFDETDVLVMAAAVADYMPESYQEKKIKKGQGISEISLKPTPDIVKELAAKKKSQFIVGFAAETEDLEDNARKKMRDKNLDLIIANDITKGIFGSDSTSISIIDRQGAVSRYDKISKTEAAEIILDAIIERLPGTRE
jgi:phosphopantothenoylcysteine decarboxylase/phosphopantothenate--cysteine ligase